MAALLLSWERRGLGRLLALGYFPLGLGAVLLTASRGGFLAVVVALSGCWFLLIQKHRKMALGGSLALPLVGVALWFAAPHATFERIATIADQLRGGDLNERLNIWAAGWRAFVRAPFFGQGAGSFIGATGLAPMDTAHNTALSILVEGGVFAFILSFWHFGLDCALCIADARIIAHCADDIAPGLDHLFAGGDRGREPDDLAGAGVDIFGRTAIGGRAGGAFERVLSSGRAIRLEWHVLR
jgi:hypothetical protein